MIIKKSPAEIEAMKKKRVAFLQRFCGQWGLVWEPGVSTLELDRLAETLIRLEGRHSCVQGAMVDFPGAFAPRSTTKSSMVFRRRTSFLKRRRYHLIDTGATVDGWVGITPGLFPVGNVASLLR